MSAAAILALLVGWSGIALGEEIPEAPVAPSGSAEPDDAGVETAADAAATGAVAEGAVPPRPIELAAVRLGDESFSGLEPTVVTLRLVVGADGYVREAEPLPSSLPETVLQAARQAALESRFEPATKDGQPMSAIVLFAFPLSAPVSKPIPEATPPAASPAAPETRAAPEAQPVVVMVHGQSVGSRMEGSAQAVEVIVLEQAQVESADLGTVIARAPGVTLRRTGGLGSDSRFAINGMEGDQVRFLIDGLPLDFVGYPFGVANVPVNLISRVEIYSGVVPIRFGADALGGAINLVSDETLGQSIAGISYQYGSFATHRATALIQHADRDSGLFVRAEAFRDAADNDYAVDVLIPDEVGQEQERRVSRFHDAFDGYGVGVEAGVVGRPWARRLSLRGFVTGFHKELQTNRTMTVPFGEAETHDSSAALVLRYLTGLGDDWSLSIQSGYSRRSARFIDVAGCVYTWLGRCIRERQDLGEVGTYKTRNGADQRTYRDQVFNRSLLSFYPTDWLTLGLSVAPTYVHQTGEDVRITDPEIRDPLEHDRDLVSLINGIEGKLELLDDDLEVIAFGKQYLQWVDTVEGNTGEAIRAVERSAHYVGAGALCRYDLNDWLLGKASYEWATRLPDDVELLGDAGEVLPNPHLRPERSHNINLAAALHLDETALGSWSLSVAGFLRALGDLILLLPDELTPFSQYRNLYDTRATGLVAEAAWMSRGEYVSLNGNITTQRHVATSGDGPFGYLKGKRIPHRPSLYGNAELRLQLSDVLRAKDRCFLSQYLNWVDEFYRGWEGVGAEEHKLRVPAQLTLQTSIGYQQQHAWGDWSASLELDNVTDAKVFDYYGAQKPGRALYMKLTGQLK